MPKVEALTKRTLKQVASNKLDDKVMHDLTPNHSRIPLFYGLPKDHKPLRGTTSTRDFNLWRPNGENVLSH